MLDLDVQWRRGGFQLDVCCRVGRGVTGVFGPSGAGKSTLLHLIAGIERPDSGRIQLEGEDLAVAAGAAGGERRAFHVPPHRRRIGMVFQDGRLFPHLSVHQNLRYGFRLQPAGDRRLTLVDVVELLELNAVMNRPVGMLSGGERQRVALGRALLASPRLLLLDEPLSSLDAALKRQVLPFLQRVRTQIQIPMLYVSHDISETLQLTGELLVLEAGHVLGTGRFHEVINDPAVFRLAQSLGLENVLLVRIAEHWSDEGLTRLEVLPDETGEVAGTGVDLWGPIVPRAVGEQLHVAVRPEDIAISVGPVEGTSIRNQLRGRVVRLTEPAGRGLLEVDIGTRLLVEISLKSVHVLALAPGSRVHCLLKAHAVRYLDA
ncbi:MAG: spermidine/putrescine ABC transporter ATP-binding protein [Phycisphaerae bacterium]